MRAKKTYPGGVPLGSPSNRDPRLNVPGHAQPYGPGVRERMQAALGKLISTYIGQPTPPRLSGTTSPAVSRQ